MTRIKSLTHVLSIFAVLSLLFGSAINVRSVSAATITVINTDKSGPGSLRQAIIYADPDDTIKFAPNLSGGVIQIDAPLNINKNLFIDGSALAVPISIDGGGTYTVFRILTGVDATLDSLIIQNGLDMYGGGIYIESNSNLTVANCTFSGNSADYGGGIWNQSGTLTVTNSTFSGNSAGMAGGGIFNEGGTLIVTNSTFSGNSTNLGGGGIANSSGTVTVTNSTFSGNSAVNTGGGIANSSGTVTVTNSTFSGNSAENWGGGGIANSPGTLTVTNSTFSGNSAGESWGGGIYNSSNGTLNYVNTIIANSLTGGDCVNDGGAIGTNSKNLVEDGSCDADYYDDPVLGPLADNGGPTETHALLSGSGAIDNGDDLLCPATDQRGVPRPQGAGCDIGSYEYALFVYLPMVLK